MFILRYYVFIYHALCFIAANWTALSQKINFNLKFKIGLKHWLSLFLGNQINDSERTGPKLTTIKTVRKQIIANAIASPLFAAPRVSDVTVSAPKD